MSVFQMESYMKNNLLSIVKLCQDYNFEFHKDVCYVIDPNSNQVVTNAKLDHDNLFKFCEFTSSKYPLQKILILMCGMKGLLI